MINDIYNVFFCGAFYFESNDMYTSLICFVMLLNRRYMYFYSEPAFFEYRKYVRFGYT